MSKSTLSYLITLGVLIVLTVIMIQWRINLDNYATQIASGAAQASSGNKGNSAIYANNIADEANSVRDWAAVFLAATCCTAVFGLMEFVILPLLSLSRIGALMRVTYHEGLLQPFTLIVFFLCVTAIIVTAFVPFNTFEGSDENKMFRDIALSYILMFILIIMVFATGKVIDEEIENRTMLTLMSKPLARWQVIIGKYLGILCLIFFTMAIATIIAMACSWLRNFYDMRIDLEVSDTLGRQAIYLASDHFVIAMIPAFILQFMELATLAAISTAIATRYGLALNMTVIVLLYICANLTRFVSLLDLGSPWQTVAQNAAYLLPYLSNFDLNQCLVYRDLSFPGAEIDGAPTIGQVVQYVATTCLYGLFYIGAALSLAIAMFRNRELT
ncbi:MAG TPA: ABC transporter permease [Phycisphaerae bacterium]|nr:ABC transporter permease [Phycisphaerae bacterium]